MNAPVKIKTEVTDTPPTLSTHPIQPKLKIALLGYRSHRFVGGQGIYIKYLSRALRKLGHTVHVYSGQPYPELDEHIHLIKVPSLNLYESPNHIRALKWKHLLSFSDFFEWFTMATGGFAEPYTFGRRVFKLLKDKDYDIIHDNQSLCSGLIKLQERGHCVVSTIHHPIHRDRALALAAAPNRSLRLLTKRWHSFLGMQEKVVAKLKHVITVSEQSQQDISTFFQRPPSETPIIFNGIDTKLFCPSDQPLKSKRNLLTTSSSDQPLKGLKSLLLALDIVKRSHPDIILNIIGELKSNGPNEKLINDLNLTSNIRFHKGVSTQRLIELYHQAHAVVCPSLYEGFGLPAAEALACGTAVISSDGGALPEVVGDTGIIFSADNHAELADAITTLLNNDELRRAYEKRGRARALNHFCWDRVAEQLSQHYFNIL